MPENTDGKKPKLENYLAYGMSFGLLGGVFLSLIGTMLENIFIQVGGFGIGLSLGTLIGTLFYSIENKK